MYNYKENVGVWEMNNKFKNTKERQKDYRTGRTTKHKYNSNYSKWKWFKEKTYFIQDGFFKNVNYMAAYKRNNLNTRMKVR